MSVDCPFFTAWKNYCGLFFFERRALKYSTANEAKPNNPIIEMIMIPNSELCMLISGRRVSRENKGSIAGLNAALRLLYSLAVIYTQKI